LIRKQNKKQRGNRKWRFSLRDNGHLLNYSCQHIRRSVLELVVAQGWHQLVEGKMIQKAKSYHSIVTSMGEARLLGVHSISREIE